MKRNLVKRHRAEPAPSSFWQRLYELPARPDRGGLLMTVIAASISGAMWFLAGADFDIWPLSYVAAVPLFWVIERAPTRRRALFLGWLAGLVTNMGGFYWIIHLLTRHAAMPWILGLVALLLLCAYQALVFLFFAAAVRRIRAVSAHKLGAPLPMVLVAPLCMVAFEILVPFIFPWYLAVTQAWVTPMIQLSELTGPVGVTAVLMVINGAIWDVLTGSGARRRLLCAAAGAGILAATLVFGHVRMSQIDARRQAATKVKVGLVQSNEALDLHARRPPAELLEGLQDVSADLERQGAELLVWPEGSFPYYIERRSEGDALEPPRIREQFSVPVVVGALTGEFEQGELASYPHNSALMLDPDGRFRGRYDKMYLLMFGEYIPGLETFPWIRSLLPEAASHFASGKSVTTFPFSRGGVEYRLGPLICYEDILPHVGRELGVLHPHLLVNLTNDTWFGDSAEPWQHLALSVFRAVELRSDLVRSVTTGVSAHVDASGRVRERTYVVDPVITPRPVDGIVVEAALMAAGHTFYARHGNVFGYLCTALALFLWLAWPRVRRAGSAK